MLVCGPFFRRSRCKNHRLQVCKDLPAPSPPISPHVCPFFCLIVPLQFFTCWCLLLSFSLSLSLHVSLSVCIYMYVPFSQFLSCFAGCLLAEQSDHCRSKNQRIDPLGPPGSASTRHRRFRCAGTAAGVSEDGE